MRSIISVGSLKRIIEKSIVNKIIEEENKKILQKKRKCTIRWTNRKQIVRW